MLPRLSPGIILRTLQENHSRAPSEIYHEIPPDILSNEDIQISLGIIAIIHPGYPSYMP